MAPEPHDASPTLIVAATAMELAPLTDRPGIEPVSAPLLGMQAWRGRLGDSPVMLATTGVGTVCAATAITAALAAWRPRACWMTGIAGAYVGAFVPVGSVVAAADDVDLDAGIATSTGPRPWSELGFARCTWDDARQGVHDRRATDPVETHILAVAAGIVPLTFATSDSVSGDLDVARDRADRTGASVESMEGFAGAVACARAGIPFAQLRGISNVAGIRDKAAWDTKRATGAAARAIVAALRTLP